MTRSLRTEMAAAGWPLAKIDTLVDHLRANKGTVLHVDSNVVAIRVRGALQRTYRYEGPSCVGPAKEATKHFADFEPVVTR